jgi:glycolate oxidase iron-sulfur subunit
MPPAPRPVASAPDRLLALTDRCVQCGLCLPACPTYGLDRNEAESPRGRIALVRAWSLGTVEPTVAADAHLDHCLGCRSCEAVCPAGVRYGELLTEARGRQRARRGHGDWKTRTTEWLTTRPRLLAALFSGYRRLFGLVPPALRRLPRPPPPVALPPRAATTRAADAALFIGCIAGPYEPPLRAAVVRLCAAAGVRVALPPGQTCCGTLHAHAGNLAGRQRLAAVNRGAFSGSATVLTLASGCHEAVAAALSGNATTTDAIAFLERHATKLRFRATRERLALHLPCTQRNVVKSSAPLRALLARVPGLEIVELEAGYGCCGAAGLQMLEDPQRAAAYREPLLAQFARTGATRLLSANIGCRLLLANATAQPVQHPLEFLAECLAGATSTGHDLD